LDDWAADRRAVLVLHLDGLRLGLAVDGVVTGRAVLLVHIAVEGVAAGLGDGVHDTASSLTELSGVAGVFRGEFLDGVDRVDVGRADRATTSLREERLVVVCAVDDVRVVDAGDAAEADEAGVSVGNDIRGQEHEVIEAATVNREVRYEDLRDSLRRSDLFRVEQRRVGRYHDVRRDRSGCQGGIHRAGVADGDVNVLDVDFAEGSAADDDFI